MYAFGIFLYPIKPFSVYERGFELKCVVYFFFVYVMMMIIMFFNSFIPDNQALGSVILSTSVVAISDWAFAYSNLTMLTIPT